MVILCDTNGEPTHNVSRIVKDVITSLEIQPDQDSPQLGIHTHNDSGTAVANGLAGVVEGVRMVQEPSTVTGTLRKCELMYFNPQLQLKMGYHCLEESQLTQLT
uniref:hypothetical protein n=1 Tax=Cyanothece sp. BG0011 TaxID=2082950 RepID=UPI0030D9565B